MNGIHEALTFLTNGVRGRSFSDEELEQQLQILNKPFVKSFKMGHGNIFDCFNIYKQPALSHPLLRGHKIQMKPSNVRLMDAGKSAYMVQDVDFGNRTQTCPAGTVPIRRTSKGDLIKGQILMKALSERMSNPTGYNHERVISRKRALYYGVYAQINLQNPKLEDGRQFSEAVLRLESGEGDQFNVIQAGWMVYRALFNDNHTHLVTSWTVDGGKSTGCYTLCPGFVQVHRRIAPGYMFHQMSTFGGDQWEMKYLMFMDRYSAIWWLVLGRTYERIGYWPKAIFTRLQSYGDAVEWGGQVFSPPMKANPPMGSGHFAQEGFKKAAFFGTLQFLDDQFNHIHLQWGQLVPYAMSPDCYTLSQFGSNAIFYGGPGGNCSK